MIGVSRQPLRIFISSPYSGLEDYRSVVNDTILRLGQYPLAMEYFGTQPGGAVAVSVASLADADVYVLLVAWRYGTIKDGETRSVTHLEYAEAVSRNLPRFVYLAAPGTEHDDRLFPVAHRDHEHLEDLRAFRDHLEANELRSYFTSAHDLGRLIAVDLGNYLRRLIEQEHDSRSGVVPRILPPRPVGFVGRERELSSLCAQLLQARNTGISVQITGMGGIGKSTLASEVVHTLAGSAGAFPDGIVTVSCNGQAGLPGLEWIYDRILAAWRVTLSPDALATAGSDEKAVFLREDALRTRAQSQGGALLFLDNVERELPLDRLVETMAGLGFATLVTSRVQSPSLRLYQHKIDVLTSESAIQLFIERYVARGGDWDGNPDLKTVSAIVTNLGYLPLAISLAAARAGLRQINPQALLHELAEPMSLNKLRLPGGSKEGVRYVLDQSVRSLTPVQQARFAALGSLHNTEWPRAIVESLFAAVRADDAASAEDDLDLFATYSLVDLFARTSGDSSGAQSRVRIHPVLHELAHEYWQEIPTETQIAAIEGLLRALNAFVRAYSKDFSVLERDEIVIVGAVNTATQQHIAVEPYRDLITSLDDYLNFGGRWNLHRALLQERVQADRQLHDLEDESLAELSLGNLASRQARYDDAERYYLRCLDIAHERSDHEVECQALNNLGTLAFDQHLMDKSKQYYERAQDIARSIDDSRVRDQMLGQILMNLGVALYSQGDLSEAHSFYHRSLGIRRQLGDRAGESQTLSNLGLLDAKQRHFDDAMAYYHESLRLAREQPVDLGGQGQVLGNLGNLAADQGHMAEAQQYYQEAFEIFAGIGATHLAQMVQENIEILRGHEGQAATAPGDNDMEANQDEAGAVVSSSTRNEWLRGRRSKAYVRSKPSAAQRQAQASAEQVDQPSADVDARPSPSSRPTSDELPREEVATNVPSERTTDRRFLWIWRRPRGK